MDQALSVTEDNTYRYNTEEEISMQVLRDLQKAVNTFDPAKDRLELDPFYPQADRTSDIVKWRKFANTLAPGGVHADDEYER